LLSAPSKKSFSSVSSPIFAHRLLVHGRLRRSIADARAENIGSPALELRFPRRDLIGVDVELLRQLSQCLMAASAPFALKADVWFRRGRLLIVSPDSRGTSVPAVRQKLHLASCSDS